MTNNLELPIFPLPLFVLPQGITKLRIFEPRYLRMVKIASQEQGFVILLTTKNTRGTLWGSWVSIINFTQGDDGILEIDVQCQSLVLIRNTRIESDQLTFGTATHLPHWSATSKTPFNHGLADSLAEVLANDDLLTTLYSQPKLNDKYWVTARWLELIPVSLSAKDKLTAMNNFQATYQFILSITHPKL